MKCEKYNEKLPLYILDELSSNEKSDIDIHLDTCEKCRIEMTEYKEIIEELSVKDALIISEQESSVIKNSVYKSVLQSAIYPKHPRNVMKFLGQAVAVLVIFFSGYFASAYYAETLQPAKKITSVQINSEYRNSFKTYKNSKLGMKLIAKGKSALEE